MREREMGRSFLGVLGSRVRRLERAERLLIGLLAAGAALVASAGEVRADPSFDSYIAHMAAAEKALRLGETGELKRFIDGAPAAHRGWEWRLLEAMSDTSERVIEVHRDAAWMAITPGGTHVATIHGRSGYMWAWPGFRFDGGFGAEHSAPIYRAEFSPDGTHVITVGRDSLCAVKKLGVPGAVGWIDLPNPGIGACDFADDGARGVTCAWERDDTGAVHGVVWVWDVETCEVELRARVGVKPLSCVRVTPDGRRIVLGSWDGLVHVIDRSGHEAHRFELVDEGVYNAINDIDVSPDGRFVAAASKDRNVHVFDILEGEHVSTLRGHTGIVERVRFSPDGSRLASAGGDMAVRTWRTSDWAEDRVLLGSTADLRGLVWAPEPGRVLACASDGNVRVWDTGSIARARRTFRVDDAGGVYTSSLSPDGSIIAVACYDGTLRLHSAERGEEIARWDAHPGSTCHGASFSADGTRVITCSWDKSARIWEVPSGRLVRRLDAGFGVYACALSPDGAFAALTGDALRIWDLRAGNEPRSRSFGSAKPRRLAFSPDGRKVCVALSDGRAQVLGTIGGELLNDLRVGDAEVEDVAFSDDGLDLVAGDNAGIVRVFRLDASVVFLECDTGTRGVSRLACAGDRIAVGSDRLCIIDSETGRIVVGLHPHTDAPYDVSFSADGRRLATSAINGSVVVYTAPDAEGAP